MQFVWIDADDWSILGMKVPDMKGILPVIGENVVVKLIPSFVSIRTSLRWEGQYHSVNAASLGPGKPAIGLRYRRYTTP